MRLGGVSLVPSEPIRRGETEAKIEIDLGDFIVTRKFKREKLEDATVGRTAIYGDTRSTLLVRTKEGLSYPSPQAVLDKLLGKLSFDPLAFARSTPKEQARVLRTLVGIDTTELDTKRKAAFDRRTVKNRVLTAAKLAFDALPKYPNVPDEPVSMDEVSAAMLKADEARAVVQSLQRAVDIGKSAIESGKHRI
jgi:hypothetical protein